MGIFGDPADDMQDVSPSEDKKGGAPIGLFFLALLMIPSVITFSIFYSFLRKGRLRPSVIFSITIIFNVLLFFFWNLNNLSDDFLHAVVNFKDIESNWGELVLPLLVIYLSIGSFLGYFATVWEARKMVKEPHRLAIKTFWTYRFEYRRTPIAYFKLKAKLKKLKSGQVVDQKRAPMGVQLKKDDFVYRYYSEAKTHTLISGASGSGKALHKDTLIPTSKGFKKVSEVSVGDTLFDEKGRETKVVGKYQPMTEDHYEITLSNDEEVKACGDHLWTVLDDGVEKTIDTRTIFNSLKNGSKVEITPLNSPVNTLNRSEDRYIDFSFVKRGLDTDSDLEGINRLFKEYVFVSPMDKEFLLSFLFNEDFDLNNDFVFKNKNIEIIRNLKIIVDSLGWNTENIMYRNGDYSFSFIKEAKKENIVIERVEEISDNREDYFCFEVDSPSHLFLFSESFIPTHNTITMQNLIYADIKNQVPTIVIDFKRSPEFASKLATWAKENDCEFYHFVNGAPEDYDIKNSDGPVRYDPLASGNATAKADMVLGMREYDTASAVYRANMQQLLQVIFSMLAVASKHPDRKKLAPKVLWDNGGLYNLASVISNVPNFEDVVNLCEGESIYSNALEVLNQLKGKTGLKHAFEELQGQIRTILASEYGEWVKTGPDYKGIDLLSLTSKPGSVILFSINSDSEPDFAKFIGSMILSDLTNVSARRRNKQVKNQVQIYIDEFQAVPPSSVSSILEKSRESSMAMTLAQQSFEQIAASAVQNGESFLNSILDTCSNFIVHNGMTEDSAERLSKILGKDKFTKYRGTNKNKSFFLSVNFGNKRIQNVQTYEEEDWVYAPREFMTLVSPSENNSYRTTAVVINKKVSEKRYKKHEGALARKVLMVPDSDVLDSYYDPDFRLSDDVIKAYKVSRRVAKKTKSSIPDKKVNSIKSLAEKQKKTSGKIPVDDILNEEDEGGFAFQDIKNPISDNPEKVKKTSRRVSAYTKDTKKPTALEIDNPVNEASVDDLALPEL